MADNESLKVKQRIGLFGAISFIIGVVIGSGIFVSPTAALLYTGSVGLCLVVWTISGCFTMMLSLIYGDLGTILPKSGGDYTFILNGIGAVPAFLVTWQQTIIRYPATRALLALVFADNLLAPIFGSCIPPDHIRKSIATAEILLLTVTNIVSVRFAASTQIVFTVAKTTALSIIVVGGIVYLFQGRAASLESGFRGTTHDVTSVALAIYSCYYAFGGYSVTNDIAEEVINPKKNIPRAVLISMAFVIVTYILVNISYFAILTKEEFMAAPAVAYAWGNKVLGPAAVLMPISVMCSVYGAGNGSIFADARLRFAAAREGHLPEVLSFLHHRTLIPVVPIIMSTAISLILLLASDVAQLMNMISFVGIIQQTLTVISYMRLRFRLNNGKSSLRIPIALPVITLVICVFLIIAPFLSSPKIEFVYGAVVVAAGLVFYVPFVQCRLRLVGMDNATLFLQLLLQVGPTVLTPAIAHSTTARERRGSRERLIQPEHNHCE